MRFSWTLLPEMHVAAGYVLRYDGYTGQFIDVLASIGAADQHSM